MSDMTLTDMTPFLERHERRARRVVIALVGASLAAAAGIFAYGTLTTGAPGTVIAKLWTAILFYPLVGILFWTGTALYARRMPAGGRPPMNTDDARNVARVANAGFVFIACMGLIMIAAQVGLALGYFGVLSPPDRTAVWIARTSAAAAGVLMIYFGNAWSRTPMPRVPQQRAVAMMKFKRVVAWLIVIYGLLLSLAALFLPRATMGIVIAVLTISMVLSTVASVLILHYSLKSRSAS
ncbi:MAG TPA: hypothetical protein VLW26_04725 [Steroidobacteraceae bacterium]|nr:hypothetical protein [Steroidobacteraceae bacterium]